MTTPTESGYYWARPVNPDGTAGIVVHVTVHHDGLDIDGVDGDYFVPENFAEFSGPLACPWGPRDRGPCGICGESVVGDRYSYTSNTAHQGRPVHDACADRWRRESRP